MKKTIKTVRSRLGRLGAAAIAAHCLGLPSANAINIFWDTNGTNDGPGTTPTGAWDGVALNWTTNSLGGEAGAFFATVGSTNDAFFSAGTDGTNAFTVTLSGTNLVNSITFQEGTPILTSGVIGLTRATSSSGNIGSLIAGSTLNGTATVDSGVRMDTSASGTLLKLTANNTAADPELIVTGPITRSSTANAFNIRLGGTGNARITSTLAGLGDIQGSAGTSMNGAWTIAGNQAVGTSGIAFSSSTTHGANARIILGDSLSDTQSWGTFTINNATPTVAVDVRGTVTTPGLLIQRSAAQVSGVATAGTLTIGSTGFAGKLQLGDGTNAGRLVLTTNLNIGSGGGSIVGGSPTNGTLTIASAGAVTVSSLLTIGGFGTDENKVQILKTGAGTLTLDGFQYYTGPTLVSAGRLDVVGSIVSSVTLSNSASLGGEGSTTGTVKFSAGTENVYFDPTTGGALTAATIDGSAATVVISPASAADGIVFQTPAADGILGAIGVNFIPGTRGGSLAFNATTNELYYTNGVAAPVNLKWTGNAANPTFWDVTVTTNWNNGVSTDRFYSGDNVLFDDTASSYLVDVKAGSVSPGNTVFSNLANAYVLTNASITGSGSVTKHGAGALTVYGGGHSFSGGLTVNGGTVSLVGGANTFTGGVTNNGGTLVIANMNQIAATTTASPNAINLNGGTFSYSGPTFSQTTDTLGFNLLGGVSTIEVSSTNNVTLRAGGAVTGSGDLIKTGAGTLALGQNNVQTPLGNTFTGKILVTGGQLDIRQQDSLGDVSGITEFTNATLYLDPFGQPSGMTFDAEPLVFYGTNFIRNFNQSATVSQVDVLTGPITNNGTLGIYSQTNGGYGELQISGNIVNGLGTQLRFGKSAEDLLPTNQNQIVNVSGSITGPASVSSHGGSGAIYTLANNNYTGDTTVTGGKLALGQATLATNSIVTVATNAVLELNFAATNAISMLVLGGVAQGPGVYSSGNAAPYLAGTGSLLVTTSLAPSQTNLTYTVLGGNQIKLEWPDGQGWKLQSQTNTLAVGLQTATNAWSDVTTTPPYTNAVNPANGAVFFRLAYP
jgi:autotransporter-associated beta strand protein